MFRKFMHVASVTVAAIVLAMVPAACTTAGSEPDMAADELWVSFRVATHELQQSRATSRGVTPEVDPDYPDWGNLDHYLTQDGTPFESGILVSAFAMSILDSQTNLKAGGVDAVVVSGPQTDGTISLSGRLELSPDMTIDRLRQGRYKAMVVANAPGMTDVSQLSTATFSLSGLPSARFEAIPMWGVATADFTGIKPGESHDIGTIDLLRAMAKVEVLVSDEVEREVTVDSLRMNRCPGAGYVAPGHWDTLDATDELEFSSTLRVPSGAGSAPLSVKGHYFYMPEAVNSSADPLEMTVHYTVDGEPLEGRVSIARYEGGFPTDRLYDVVRNHIYRFVIKSVPADGELKFNASIIDMIDGGSFNFEYDFDI